MQIAAIFGLFKACPELQLANLCTDQNAVVVLSMPSCVSVEAISIDTFARLHSMQLAALQGFDVLNKARICTVFSCDDYLTVQEDANKLITRGSWGGTVLGKDAKPAPGAFFECRWVDVFCIEDGKIASVESFFDTAAISKAFAASKQS